MSKNTTPSSKKPHSSPKPVVLCILDGWGERTETTCNAVKAANTPNWDRIYSTCPKSKLKASALDVGLPDGQMGNSEVGHMTLGAGRVIMQDLPRIDAAIHDGSLDENDELITFIEKLKKSGGTCHLMGLLSPGGVHSHHWHMRNLAAIISASGIKVMVHAFLDGRDTPPKSAADYIKRFEVECRRLKDVSIATICGRYWAMDRDKRWDRVKKAYEMLVAGAGESAQKPVDAIKAAYAQNITDEFIEPTSIDGFSGMKDGDGLLMANFRSDRAREILDALADPDFSEFERSKTINFASLLGMVDYSDNTKKFFSSLFQPIELNDILPEVVANAGMKQLHVAETEKYAHVTFFFNGGREIPLKGEKRILVPSPNVATYDQKPEMSAFEVTDKLVAAIDSAEYDFIIVNYANGDMVGHTGVMDAAVKAVETLDQCIAKLEKSVIAAGGTMLITADHGNCEKMCHAGQPHTAHTLNKVPAILVGAPDWVDNLNNGGLIDVAPTILQLLGMAVPDAMSGHSLIVEKKG
ncbi:MAG: 2,3-bisphosphoglycerate-independent phosphoglycerate mutase [Rhodospirillaceae bacterium]|nr:2,3-bisphosphoglycerate-independent phosphoglycerate mutase [Rhodospirillaceae bacterium]